MQRLDDERIVWRGYRLTEAIKEPVEDCFTITETDGFDLIGSRFGSDIRILSEGNFTTGYGIGISRTEADTNNSRSV